jgi:hypothetical protein
MIEMDTSDIEVVFKRKNLEKLGEGIRSLGQKEDGTEKSGLLNQLQFLLSKVAENLKDCYFAKEMDLEADEMARWIQAYKSKRFEFFGETMYSLSMNVMKKRKLPGALPDRESVAAVRQTCVDILANPKSSFTDLRDAGVTRATLFQGKRGGEPAKLTLSQHKEMVEEKWISEEAAKKIPDASIALQNFRITYQVVKGDKLSPIFFPRDMWTACERLADKDARLSAGVNVANPYLFATTHHSECRHVSGEYALKRMCIKAELSAEESFNFTQNRHMVATDYTSLDVTDRNLELFFEAMGHEATMNRRKYQCPPALRMLMDVASKLQDIEGESLKLVQSDS